MAETSTVLKDQAPSQGVRTIVCRQVMSGPKKDRWHPLYTTSDAEPPEVLDTFRTRQHHEQGYRVGVHDEFLNAVPCGYDKQSPNRHRPRFHRGRLQMIGWLVALVYNAMADLANHLPAYYQGMNNEMPAKLQEVFRENLRRRLQELEMSQRDLAKALDVSDATVSILLNGEHAANLDTVEKVANVLHTNSLYLLTSVNLEIIPETEPV